MRIEVFISYSRDDWEIAKQFIDDLCSKGLNVWWDDKISLGSNNFTSEIEQAVKMAQCVLVIWSKNSKNSNWVLSEVNKAEKEIGSQKIVQVCIANEDPPMPFDQFQYKRNVDVNANKRVKEEHLSEIVKEIIRIIGIQGPNEHLIEFKNSSKGWDFDALAIETPVPGMDLFLSFRPCGNSGVFLLMRQVTTDGWVDSGIRSAKERHAPFLLPPHTHSIVQYEDDGKKYLKVKSDIFFIMDPIRPYGIQIGGLRSVRPNADPGNISGALTKGELSMLPLQLDWMSMTLAEILSTEESLEFLADRVTHSGMHPDIQKKIIHLISKNPNSSIERQKNGCLFCDDTFKQYRRLSDKEIEKQHGAYIIANDFPFGPAFHYLIITSDAVHSWENLEFEHIRGLNLLIHEFLKKEENRKGAAGVSFGFNSTIRHLILGSKTRSSAGASIPHIHKQAWGMPPRGTNIAERLIEVSEAYWNHGVDYQANYYAALRKAGYVIWENKHVALYVPYGQCSKYELQVMVREPRGCLTELTIEEVISLSLAEYFALRIYKALEINSFNHVMLSKFYNDTRAPQFRLVETFITREVDFAVSELSMLFVVDQHPWDSRNEINNKWNGLLEEDLRLSELASLEDLSILVP